MRPAAKFLAALAAFALLARCGDAANGVKPEVLAIPLSLEVDRFDLAFDQSSPEGLPDLKAAYPYLFPAQFSDSVWLHLLTDTLQQQLRAEVKKAFPEFDPYQAELELLFKHIRYYFPQSRVPEKVITLTNNVDYRKRVYLTDTLLLIGLDSYLGPDHEFYGNFSRYVAQELDPRLLVGDVADQFADRVVPLPRERSFVSRMVYYGKALYLKDLLMPLAPDSVKIGYRADQWQWALDNEGQIWRYFVERELLYSTDQGLAPRFLDPAPFSKFRLELDNESPGRIGRYMGWQIVRAFMERNDVGLDEMLNTPGEDLFRRANYKPPK
ncbi:gliding motility lipoprotein GldB [Robiginitalea marina]|uniref:Gliding motility lipoprotein GldB n=1 Tax=Robiginitalea marina TaxID=2954105 RepID=A0ABT1B008_9FLAO|nr:gliding motility lipoprotein GldB [Robiginitalea marina]MCO5724753.1 gliding motility lipoprotein GldB [Robiginitalea marina]